jgi:serine/threonine protein kinase/Flp pilus assembly protein TadD
MSADLQFDDALAQRLPLPLAQLYRRAFNAKTARDRHDTAYYLWEAALKLLGSVAVAAYAERAHADPDLADKLKSLARPSVGHWWEFVRLLVPALAGTGDFAFAAVRDLLLAGRPRDDLPRAAGLDAALIESLEGRKVTHCTVRPDQLFNRLVEYRNQEFGHGAAGQRRPAHYEHVGRALLLGVADLLGRLDVLAGCRLLYVAEVRRRGDGSWVVERGDLSRELYQRAESLVLPAEAADRLPRPECLYMQAAGVPPADATGLCLLHPLLVYDAEASEVLFLNSRRGKLNVEYLSYTSGEQQDRAELAGEQHTLLRRVLDVPQEMARLDAWAAASAAEEAPASEAETPGAPVRTLGDFELVSKLGQGGMGVVYRAVQPSLQREVALKCLFRTGDPKAEARFAREIRALGRVDHPHLVKVYASGAQGEHWFYAMELIEGTTLGAVCERLQARGLPASAMDLPTWQAAVSTACMEARRGEEPLSDPPSANMPSAQAEPASLHAPTPLGGRTYVRTIAELLRQVCAAAHALHEKGIIHRDIKPGNIMVMPDGSTAVLMDLGLAQVADEVEGRLTKTRQFVGTLRYASPEQVRAVVKIDARGDVYSLGATLWELLTLRPLYGATEQTPTAELMERIQLEEPGRVRTWNPAVPRDLQAVVEKCLQKDARKRYGSARQLEEDLGRFLEGRPVKARRVTNLERAWRWARRRPALAAQAAVLGLATVGLLTVWLSFTFRLNEARLEAEARAVAERKLRDDADTERNNARAAEGKAKVAAQQAKQLLAASHISAAKLAIRQGAWRDALKQIKEALKAGHPNTAAVRLDKVRALCAVHDIAHAVDELRDLLQTKDLGSLEGEVLLWQADLTMSLSGHGPEDKPEDVRRALERGLRQVRLARRKPLSPAATYYARGLLAETSPKAIVCWKQAVAEDPFNPRAHAILAQLLTWSGELSAARAQVQLAEVLFPEDPSFRLIHGQICALADDMAGAMTQLGKVRDQLGPKQMKSALALVMLCNEVPRVARLVEEALADDPGTSSSISAAMQVLSRARMEWQLLPLVGKATMTLKDTERNLFLPVPHGLRKTFHDLPGPSWSRASLAIFWGNVDDLESMLGQVVSIHPEGSLYLARGALRRRKGGPEAWANAEKDYLRAVEQPAVFPVRRAALLGAVRMEWLLSQEGPPKMREEMRSRARHNLRKVVALGAAPRQEYILLQLALKMKEVHLAHAILGDWKHRAPDDPRLVDAQADLALTEGAYGRAIRLIDEILRQRPQDAGRWQGRRGEALHHLPRQTGAVWPD